MKKAASFFHSSFNCHAFIWTLAEACLPKELAKKFTREEAIKELAREFLKMCGTTALGEFAKAFGFSRWEAGKANHALVDKGFAERLATGTYRIKE